MTSEFLLDAIGQIDDSLIFDAEKPIKRSPPIRNFAGIAAVLALCVSLSPPFFWRAGNNAATGEAAPSSSGATTGGTSPNYSNMTDDMQTESSQSSKPGAAAPSSPGSAALFLTERGAYSLLRCRIDTLPDGCRSLGSLTQAVDGAATYPATLDADYVGCSVWESADGTILYLQLSNGNWVAAQLIDTFN